MNPNKFCMSEEERQAVCKEYLEGKTAKELALIHYCSRSTIFNYLKMNKIQLRPSAHSVRPTKWPYAMIQHDWNSGMAIDKIASTYGFKNNDCVSSFVQRMRLNGYDFKRRVRYEHTTDCTTIHPGSARTD